MIKITGIKRLTLDAVLYGCLECPTQTQRIMAWKMVNSVKAALWKARNILVFKHEILSVKDILSISLNEMHQYYIVDRKNFPILARKWLLSEWSSIICHQVHFLCEF
ncbi:hypothetical protein GDO78_020872 [Eleutherodactylus coqui]|uniref:Uncharacterized protein n=1 Tax=Eleutherodactylus coqui TaxID=57060 RepID=A0A8J6BDR2_ELECQ|nr:hypothetical protein GDO78_020872 [Eleutherodactylus coqui]